MPCCALQLLEERAQSLVPFAVAVELAMDQLNERCQGPFRGEVLISTSLVLAMSGSKTQSGACRLEPRYTTAPRTRRAKVTYSPG